MIGLGLVVIVMGVTLSACSGDKIGTNLSDLSLSKKLVTGGTIYSASTVLGVTLTAAQVCDNSQITITPTDKAIAVTFPTAAQLSAKCLKVNGQQVRFDYINAATGATTTTLTAGTGIDLESDDSSGDVISQNGTAEVSCIRTSSSVIRCKIDPYTNAD